MTKADITNNDLSNRLMLKLLMFAITRCETIMIELSIKDSVDGYSSFDVSYDRFFMTVEMCVHVIQSKLFSLVASLSDDI